METFVERFPHFVLHVFGGLLLALLPALFYLLLKRAGVLDRLSEATHWFATRSRGEQTLVLVLLAGVIVYGSVKPGGGSTNSQDRASLPRLARGLPAGDVILPADVLRGYRMAGTDGGGPVEMPAGAVTNELLRRRGGHDWAFRVEPDNWRSSWKDGALSGVTVFARGEVRPDVGTLYYPVPLTNGVSLLPEAGWGLLPDGEVSVFSHAVTTNGSLLLDWRNALVGRDPNAPTNLQMEIFSDGSFVWRTDDGSTSYLPVLPFDYDGDGLENSVDPEPLVPNSVDAHGTPPEWYRIVCSNVFETAGGDFGWKEGVNTNAYYFVDVVAEEGPAPVWFNADRESRLGSPVVVARAGETNRVPLLIGVGYSVTSTVPISVSTPMDGFAVVTSNDARSVTVKWPLEFTVTTSVDGHTVTVTPVPYDPGGIFEWDPVGDSTGGARLMSASSSTCSYAANGGCVSWSCGTDSCGCRGCSISGNYTFEDAVLNLPTVWCGCWEDDPEEPEPTPEPHSDMASKPSVTATFSEPVVLFEDVYTNAPGEVVQRQSTTTTLTISAYGGANGAYLQVDPGILETKLVRTDGHRLPTSKVKIPQNSDVVYEIAYQGKVASGAAKDIKVRAILTAINDMSPSPSTAEVTSARLQMEAVSTFPTNRARHVFGPLEEARMKVYPGVLTSAIEMIGNVPHEGKIESRMLTVGTKAATFNLDVKCDGAELTLAFSVIEPAGSVQGLRAEPFTNGDWEEIEENPLLSSESGVAGNVWVRVLPQYVSFQHIRMLEGTAPAVSIWGCCTNQVLFPPDDIAHGVTAGGTPSYAQQGTAVLEDNLLGPDRVAFWPPGNLEFPCGGGGYSFDIPWKWYADKPGVIELHDWMTVRQEMTVENDGTSKVRKNGIVIRRRVGESMTWSHE